METVETAEKSGVRRTVAKWLIAIIVMALVVCALGGTWYHNFQKGMAAHASFQMPPEAVTSVVVSTQNWPATISAVGTVKPVNGLVLSADLAGNVSAIALESGAAVKKGTVLVQQDITEEQAQLRAAEARKRLTELNLQRFKGLLDKRVSSQSDYDQTASAYIEADARCQEIRAVIEKKTIRAPFDGLAGIRQVNVGQYLQPGEKIVPLQSMSPVYVNFSLPQQNLASVQPGIPVRITPSGGDERAVEGTITAVDSVVDEATRNVLIQSTVVNADKLLRPGMFVRVVVLLPGDKPVLALPATSVSYAPYGDSVFVIEKMTDEETKKEYTGVRQQMVKLGEARGDQVQILSGIQEGNEIATSGIFKLRPKASVAVKNEILPGNSLDPQPKDK